MPILTPDWMAIGNDFRRCRPWHSVDAFAVAGGFSELFRLHSGRNNQMVRKKRILSDRGNYPVNYRAVFYC
jgi:hypothetical protein